MPELDHSTMVEIETAQARCRAAGRDPKAVVRHVAFDGDGRRRIVDQLQ